jgi:two-component system, NarL family, response regulator NreC
MKERARVLLADDDAMVRQLLALLISEGEFDVVAEAADGQEAVEKAEQVRPDIVVLDLNMPRLSGLEAALRIRAISPGTRILVLTMTDDEEYVEQLELAGAAGYLVKDRATFELVRALRAVRAGQTFYASAAGSSPAAP